MNANIDTEQLQEVWKASLLDVSKGFATGPWYEEDEISQALGTPHWVAMPRFPLQQGEKVRPIDDGSHTGSHCNSFARMTEKLWVPSADYIVAVIRSLASKSPHQLGGWIVDEKSAFRQLPVLPAHRTTAVVAMCNPDTGRIGHFLMTGHPFGLTSSVFNFNRRATALTDIMVKEFKCICLHVLLRRPFRCHGARGGRG